jgi:predicted nucleotidyltransferase
MPTASSSPTRPATSPSTSRRCGPAIDRARAFARVPRSRYHVAMTRTDAISQLLRHADAIKAMGATSLYLFGSTARNEAAADSDLDLFLEYDPESRFSLIDLVGIKLFLEETLGIEADVTTRDSLHPMLKEKIERSAVRVF